MIPESLYSVSRAEYKDFVESIKPEARDIQQVDLNNWAHATKIFSNKTGKCLCSRVCYEPRNEEETPRPETYYIFEYPDADESQVVVPKRKLVLETKEEVQAFFRFCSKDEERKWLKYLITYQSI